MNMIKAAAGMMKWKNRMKKLENDPSYTDEWWQECAEALEFLPEAEREGFIDTFINLMIQN